MCGLWVSFHGHSRQAIQNNQLFPEDYMNKLVVLLVAVFCSISIQAQELSQNAIPTKPVDEKSKQLAEKLLIATKVDENITRTMAAIKKSQMAALSKQFTGAQLQNAGEISEAVGAIMEKELCWDNILPPFKKELN